MGHACVCPRMVTVASQFWSYTPPQKKLVFRRPKNENSPLNTECARAHFWIKNLRLNFCPLFWLFLYRKFCHAGVDSRKQQAILLKKVDNFRPKLRFSCFPGDKVDTILSRCSRLSRTSRAPSRLIRPRLINCDAGRDRQMKIFPVFGQLFFRTSSKKFFFSRPASSCDLRLERSPLPDFIFRATNAGKKQAFLGATSLCAGLLMGCRSALDSGREKRIFLAMLKQKKWQNPGKSSSTPNGRARYLNRLGVVPWSNVQLVG